MKYIKISARSAENKNDILDKILNVIALVAHGGDLPTERDLQETNRQNNFTWWTKELRENRFQVGPNNSHWVNIERDSETETDIVLHLHARYDFGNIFTNVIPVVIGFMFKTDEQVIIIDSN